MTAGYSKTPLVRKLGLRPGFRACLLGAPRGYGALLEPVPDGIVWLKRPGRAMDFIQVFVRDRARLARRLPALKARLAAAGMLWICWPKKTSALARDLSGQICR